MPEDKRKMLQALAAKRKADNEAGGRKKPKEAAAAGMVTGKKDPVKVIGGGGKLQPQKSSPVSKGKETAKGKPAKKKAAKWDSGSETSEEEAEDVSGESDESEEEDLDDSENSDDSDVPKKNKKNTKPAAKPTSAKKGKAVLPVSKGKDLKGKGKKAADSDDSGAENGVEDDDSDLSEDPLDEVNPDNILPSRTRRRTAQPVSYDFGSGDLDEDDDSDEE